MGSRGGGNVAALPITMDAAVPVTVMPAHGIKTIWLVWTICLVWLVPVNKLCETQ
jgi:hypothetical protein